MERMIAVFVVGFLAGAFTGVNFHSAPIQKESVASFSIAEKYALERDIEILTKKLSEEERKCDLKSTLVQAVEEKKLGEERARKAVLDRLIENKRAEERLLQLARGGELSLEKLSELLVGKSKEEVIDLLGKPAETQMPPNSDGYGLQKWKYLNKVKMVESNTKRSLLVYVEAGKVYKVTALN